MRTIVGPQPASAGASAAERSTEVALALPALPRGTYRAAWQARSADDLHLTTGTTVFGVGDPVVDAPTDRSGPAPDVPGLALRWLQLALLGLVVGAALHGAVVVPRSSLPETFRRQIQGQLGRAMGLGAALSALVGLAVLVQVSTGVEGSGAVVWTSAFGGFWLLGEASFLVLVLLAAGASTRGWDRRRSAVAAVALTLALLATGGSGHVAPDAGRPLAVALLTAHLAAGAAWAGGLLVLLLLAGTSARRGRASWAHSLLRAFGAPAAVSLGVLVVTGVALTSRQVASVDALLTTTYGRVLVAKVGLGLLAGLLGLRTHRALRRAVPADRGRCTRRMRLELALLGGRAGRRRPARGRHAGPGTGVRANGAHRSDHAGVPGRGSVRDARSGPEPGRAELAEGHCRPDATPGAGASHRGHGDPGRSVRQRPAAARPGRRPAGRGSGSWRRWTSAPPGTGTCRRPCTGRADPTPGARHLDRARRPSRRAATGDHRSPVVGGAGRVGAGPGRRPCRRRHGDSTKTAPSQAGRGAEQEPVAAPNPELVGV